MAEYERAPQENNLNSLAGAITKRIWLETQRRNATVARITKKEPIQTALPLNEARYAVVKGMVRDLLEDPSLIDEVAINLSTFMFTEQASDDVQQAKSLSRLPANEQTKLVDSVAREVTAMFGQDIKASLADFLMLRVKAEDLARNKGISASKFFTDDELYRDLIRTSLTPIEFARRRIATMGKINLESLKKVALNISDEIIAADGSSKEEIKAERNQLKSSPELNLVVSLLLTGYKITEFVILMEQLSRFYGLETVLRLQPELKKEMGIEQENTDEF